MSLADLFDDSALVEAPNGKTITVRPLSLEGVAVLLKNYGAEVESLFSGKKTTKEILMTAPGFAAAMIAAGTGDSSPEMIEVAKKMPIGLQIKLLDKIWDLSCVDAEEMGKFISRLLDALTKAADNLSIGLNLSGSSRKA